jgi:hypothetical protein
MQTTTGTPTETNLSLEHLLSEFARIDLLIRREVSRWQVAGQDSADTFRGLYVSDDEAEALLARPFGASWGDTASPGPGEEKAFSSSYERAARRGQELAEAAQSRGQTPRLVHLANAFGLDDFELDALLICLAPTLDLRYEQLFGYLQDDVTRRRPMVNLVLNMLCEPGSERLLKLSRFADDAPLFRFQLLQRAPRSGPDRRPVLGQMLVPDQAIAGWLLGKYQPHADLGPHAALLRPQESEAGALLAADVLPSLERAAAERPVIVFCGPDQAGQLAAAKVLAARAGRSLLTVDLAAVTDESVSPSRALGLGLRDARLTGAVPYLTGWDVCLTARGSGGPPPGLMTELCGYPDLAIVAGRESWQPSGMDRDRTLVWLEFPIPSYPQRRALWTHLLETEAKEEQELDVTALAGQFLLTTGQIRDAVASAKDMAAQRGGPLATQDLFAAARIHSNPRLAGLARKIVPRYDWGDIVLPADQLALLGEIIATVRSRSLVLEEWGVGKKLASSKAVTLLFAGEPGTGKTMAAEIVAAELGLDLFKIDLSTVVSKYIGETEKNLEKIFNEAQSSNAILFFDEADAIFGKRSEVKDAHDRYANIEISYLLQRMEIYDGVTILATNLRANLDEAFTRRIQFAVDFPFPEEEDRLRIWHTLFPPDVPRDAELDFGLLAQRFKLAGGSIRNIIVSAAYLAASDGCQVTMQHLLHGTRRELQKMGRLVREDQLRLLGAGDEIEPLESDH